MTCEHLRALEQAILESGIRETSRGQAWSENCREWVYFHCFIATAAVRERFPLEGCVRDHEHRGTHDGSERGFICEQCHDGLMGWIEPAPGVPVFPQA
jgi:hypothetical protein